MIFVRIKYLIFIILTLPCYLYSDNNSISVVAENNLSILYGGKGVTIARFIINSDPSTGFKVVLNFEKNAKLGNESGEIPFTSLIMTGSSGTLGTGLTAPENIDVLSGLSGGEFTFDFGDNQTSSTINYLVELKASWDVALDSFSGYYYEKISVQIISN